MNTIVILFAAFGALHLLFDLALFAYLYAETLEASGRDQEWQESDHARQAREQARQKEYDDGKMEGYH